MRLTGSAESSDAVSFYLHIPFWELFSRFLGPALDCRCERASSVCWRRQGHTKTRLYWCMCRQLSSGVMGPISASFMSEGKTQNITSS